jgi:hypothetical protein
MALRSQWMVRARSEGIGRSARSLDATGSIADSNPTDYRFLARGHFLVSRGDGGVAPKCSIYAHVRAG